ncbi:MAG: hypothetical protein HC780_10930 [Leptolyngbyaceae cyanobacterium CSU_1_3]|nr:hypothetical protein [Leptolyngbyaceae cyanobacterium CSU_1_3]
MASGELKQVTSRAGHLLPIARDPVTGRFFKIAKGVTQLATGPLVAIAEFTSSAVQTGILGFQMDRGFQRTYREIEIVKEGVKSLQGGMTALQTSVGILQASTALIGVGVAVNVGLSAVNLQQMLKLRQDVKQLRLEIKDGFIDLKAALQDQGIAVLQRLDEVANDLKFHSQKLIMVKAYGQFQQAVQLMKTALICADVSTRNDTLTTALNLLTNALAIYTSPELFTDTTAVGSLRRMECIWAIKQMIALIYQLRGEPNAVREHLSQLCDTIQQDSLTVVNLCEWEEELDLLFPELLRIQRCDLPVLQTWQGQIEWYQALPMKEQERLATVEMQSEEETPTSQSESSSESLSENLIELSEQVFYDNLKQTSHFLSLRDQLRFIVKPELRQNHETYIAEQSKIIGYKALVPAHWHEMSDLAIANLYWHLKRTDYAA